jgi:Xaa-Pro aminopeptidase
MTGKHIAVDPDRAVAAIFGALQAGGAHIIEERDPTILPKAVKNPIEQSGHRAAQARDGAALSRFLHWMRETAYKGELNELSAAARLRAFREDTGMLKDLSFDTISATGPNGAHCHYKVDESTNRSIAPNSIYLVDSGGQYLDGTTDVTRTIWVGPGAPTAEMKDRFTRVLKGHIALACAVFPEGTRGAQLDSMARASLWQAGLDYAHGTGHGVGSFLAGCLKFSFERLLSCLESESCVGRILAGCGSILTGCIDFFLEQDDLASAHLFQLLQLLLESQTRQRKPPSKGAALAT